MRANLLKSVERNQVLDMMYVDGKGKVSKRRIKVLMVGDKSFRAYCHLRSTRRTFTIDNVLALVPVVHRERSVI
ncbi:transcriptional regulator [Sporosarcina sp. FSL K6-2383]|uniref:transcriptional regulator n=1 Tax=Sporosarcina sp. FSL K6-2383 TaxID=2921556 RepID=UPI00315ACC3F